MKAVCRAAVSRASPESQMRIKAVKVFRTDAAGYNASVLSIA